MWKGIHIPIIDYNSENLLFVVENYDFLLLFKIKHNYL